MRKFGYDPQYDPVLTGYANLFEFDESARRQSFESLAEDIPRYIYDEVKEKEIIVGELFSRVSNQTPATESMLNQSLDDSIKRNEIQAISEKGVKRRKGSAMQSSDTIVAVQKPFFYFSGSDKLFGE